LTFITALDACVVDQDVQTPVGLDCELHDFANVRLLGDIGLDKGGFTTPLVDSIRNGLAGGGVHVVHHDLCPLFCKGLRNGLADTRAGACNECDLVL
jgi:hypothetical protein